MPEAGGTSTQSGVFYQNTISALFIVKMLLEQDNIEAVRVESDAPVGDIELFLNNSSNIFIQVKESAPKGNWTVTSWMREGFLDSALSQHRLEPDSEIWFITGSSAKHLKELADRCRRVSLKGDFKKIIGDVKYLNDEFEKAKQFIKLDELSACDLFAHIYVKDSFGSAQNLSSAILPQLTGSQGEDVFPVLRDTVAEGARERRKYCREDIMTVLRQRGLIPVIITERKAIFTENIDDFIKSRRDKITEKIQNAVGEKYRANLYVSRDVQKQVELFVLRTAEETIRSLGKLRSSISMFCDSVITGDASFVNNKETITFLDRCNLLGKTIIKLTNRLSSGEQIDWSVERPELEDMIANLKCPEGSSLVDELRMITNNITVIVDRAGRGKTNLLAHLAIEWSNQVPVVFFLGGEFASTDHRGIAERIANELGLPPDPTWGRGLDSIKAALADARKYIIVIVDGINENQDSDCIRKVLFDLAVLSEKFPIRTLLSCRDVHWSSEFHVPGDVLDSHISTIIRLGDFTEVEFEEVWPKYCNRFHLDVMGLSNETTYYIPEGQ